MSRVVRVAAGQGFWGDWLEAPRRQVEGGPIDYLMLDYLAEVTMSILQKQKERDPSTGYARDFVGALFWYRSGCEYNHICVYFYRLPKQGVLGVHS